MSIKKNLISLFLLVLISSLLLKPSFVKANTETGSAGLIKLPIAFVPDYWGLDGQYNTASHSFLTTSMNFSLGNRWELFTAFQLAKSSSSLNNSSYYLRSTAGFKFLIANWKYLALSALMSINPTVLDVFINSFSAPVWDTELILTSHFANILLTTNFGKFIGKSQHWYQWNFGMGIDCLLINLDSFQLDLLLEMSNYNTNVIRDILKGKEIQSNIGVLFKLFHNFLHLELGAQNIIREEASFYLKLGVTFSFNTSSDFYFPDGTTNNSKKSKDLV